MRRGGGLRLGFIIAVILVTVVVLAQKDINLGLDLQGGVHVVMEAEPAEGQKVTDDLMNRVIAVIDRRVNGLGVAEPIVQRQGDRRVIIELPGITDQQTAIETIGKTAQLEIKNPLGQTVLTGADLQDAYLSTDALGRAAVAIKFTPEGAKKFAALTTTFQGQRIPHILDGEVLVNPEIQEPILGGEGQIVGSFTIDEAKNLAVLLKAGALPVPMEIIEVRNIGPTLGQESIDQSLKAGILGIGLVLLFMLVYYKLPGLIADIALGIYVLILLAAMALLDATLTLPGIAGFILTVGMAVDANVIIFERIKEEMAAGKSLRASIDAGFHRAFSAILDSNLTTIIAAAILFYFGTSSIRGFAVTLSLGVAASMFTAITVTRAILNVIVDANPEKAARYFNMRGLAK